MALSLRSLLRRQSHCQDSGSSGCLGPRILVARRATPFHALRRCRARQDAQLARLVTSQALQQADYTFYQRLQPSEVTEEYLWDQRLLPLLGYLTADQTVKVKEALSLAFDAHNGQRRKSGEPFITHPVEVTRILAELKMDYECLVAGLLHDTVEDCSDMVGLDEIEFHFGRNVRRIVEGETKFCKLPSHLSGGSSDGEDALPLPGLGRGVGRVRPPSPGARLGATAPNGALANGAALAAPSSVSGAEPSSSSFSSNGLSNGGWGDGQESLDVGEVGEEECEADLAGGGCGEDVLRPKPSTFTTSENGRPLLDLVLSTPGNDKPSRAQDIQFLFLAMTEEWRIIVVKLADRLHNMRTMDSMPQGKARNIANETLEVFGPLARLLGLYSIKEELEELAFKYANPPAYDAMKREVKKLWDVQEPVVASACAQLSEQLRADSYLRERVRDVRVEPSRKALYSSWKKLRDEGRPPKDVRDIAQLRVVIEPGPAPGAPALPDFTSEKQLCYHVMGLIHSFWAPIPGSMKDYIATPKPNNYQSLHTTVLPTGVTLERRAGSAQGLPKSTTMFPIEIQIRTEAMNRVADLGIAVDTWAPPPCTALPPVNGTATGLSNGSARRQSAAAANGAGPARQQQQQPGNGRGQMAVPFLGSLMQWASSYSSFSGGSSSSDDEGLALSSSAAAGEAAAAAAALAQQQQQQQLSAGGRSTGGNSLQRLDPATMTRRINWLNSIRKWQEEFVGTLTAHEFIECVTDDILGQGVFVFTPGGQIMRLPKGATVVDFAYHIHTQIGNTMAAAKVNSKLVQPAYELQNADVVEIVPYQGPVNANVIRKHQEWYGVARTKVARHKIMRFLRENAALAASKNVLPTGGAQGALSNAELEAKVQRIWLVLQCEDRQGLLADVAQIIAQNYFNIKSYSGSSDVEAALFALNFVLEGEPCHLGSMCEGLDGLHAVQERAVGCELPEAVVSPKPRI